MKIWAARAVWSLISRLVDDALIKGDRVEARSAAQSRAAPLFWAGQESKTRVDPGNANRMLLAVPARLATALFIASARLLGSACLPLQHLAVDPLCPRMHETRALIFGKLHPKQPLDVLNELLYKKEPAVRSAQVRASLKL